MMSILTTQQKKKKNYVDSVELCIEAKRGMENTNDGAEVSENEIITYQKNDFKFRRDIYKFGTNAEEEMAINRREKCYMTLCHVMDLVAFASLV
ncbi:hypothetical protein RHMOL_Rhmol02G0287900 [Rhododendron molle]|uniref:Uncharacterized protein n=1 Tax=Rhododendron molle TaxID=49168 RepID=A0ACC0PVE2_RHOML|nr:hypothetical protein RHMOL_Rhmol02G0287900 [Rhododendron molle]